ncbi:MAG TPA: tripartite tricarboxylate transporter TctB family protein [Burkholderiales bacterium]|nr:tripartite tricarboxylate transporter TctB family protein [Burkholderiales bacterium]
MAELRNNKDFLAGLLMIGVGAGAFYMALDYPFGSALRMGPGYFPRVLAAILVAFGIFVLIRGILTGEKVQGAWGWKPLAFVVASLVVFGWTMDRFGFVPALVAMFFICTLGGPEFRLKEVVVLTVVMSLFAIGVFIYGLGMPYPLIKGFWGY